MVFKEDQLIVSILCGRIIMNASGTSSVDINPLHVTIASFISFYALYEATSLASVVWMTLSCFFKLSIFVTVILVVGMVYFLDFSLLFVSQVLPVWYSSLDAHDKLAKHTWRNLCVSFVHSAWSGIASAAMFDDHYFFLHIFCFQRFFILMSSILI